MCGRIVNALDSATMLKIAKARMMRKALDYKKSYNISPGKYLPGIYITHSKRKGENDYSLEAMKWGTKNSSNISTINARVENIELFHYFNYERCIVIIQGYYEWKVGQREKSKQPYYIHRKNQQYILLAGLFKEGNDQVNINSKKVWL